MSTTASRLAHVERVLVEVASLLIERARVETEREGANDVEVAAELHRIRELERELSMIRHELGIPTPPVPPGRQVSKFYEVPGQEDA